MKSWCGAADLSQPAITAEGHVSSGHRGPAPVLPERCVLFFLGRAIPFLTEAYPTVVLTDALPRFLSPCPCLAVSGRPDVCFLDGGRGAPFAVDTLETLHALGVRRVLSVGLCGVYADDTAPGDVLLPGRAYVEEGTSLHYYPDIAYAEPDAALHGALVRAFDAAPFRVHTEAVVSTDAIYRQTLQKEALWRKQGCIGVDMETSALFSVGRKLGMETAAALMASDRHPLSAFDRAWSWDLPERHEKREAFLRLCIDFF